MHIALQIYFDPKITDHLYIVLKTVNDIQSIVLEPSYKPKYTYNSSSHKSSSKSYWFQDWTSSHYPTILLISMIFHTYTQMFVIHVVGFKLDLKTTIKTSISIWKNPKKVDQLLQVVLTHTWIILHSKTEYLQ